MKAKMTVYKNGGKTPIVPDPKKKGVTDPKKKGIPAHFRTDPVDMILTPSESELKKLKRQQSQEMKDYKAAGRAGADQSGIFEGMKVTNKRIAELEGKAKTERSELDKRLKSYVAKLNK